MTREAFPEIHTVPFVERGSQEPLGFRHYRPDEVIEGKTMRDQLRFASCYWHTMRNGLADPFGAATARMPWDDGSDTISNCLHRADAFFEFLTKCRIDFYCFHDRDIAPERSTLAESNADLDRVVDHFADLSRATGKKLLWGTACLFAHPRYVSGAATSPRIEVFAHAAAQVKKALEVTHRLGGEGYVFWGGREGYTTLLNTDLKREREHLAHFLHMAVEYKRAIGFKGQFYIEPKPREPSVHQYDSDAAACLAFLREFGLLPHFKLNIETNHATLAGHSVEHELAVCRASGVLGSVDANSGTDNCGWDTDEFPTDPRLTTKMMLEILAAGGFTTGGLNFDAKRRRESFEPVDLFHAHVAGMDAFARGLKAAAAIRADGRIAAFLKQRYASWDSELGRRIESGDATLEELEKLALHRLDWPLESGRQEMLEQMLHEHI
ncbi:MAG: xylose isomerase [Limnohabitans sp.]|jgi:xylose isomerase|nr:xylose isomerase [Limnohabitans sp.]